MKPEEIFEELLVVRASSYGDYFFVAPVLERLKQKYKRRIKITYVHNGALEAEYVKRDPHIDELLLATRLPGPWEQESFEVDEPTAARLLSFKGAVLSYEATDGDHPFGDMTHNLFQHYLRMAALPTHLDGVRDVPHINPQLLSNPTERYCVIHPFSSQSSRSIPTRFLQSVAESISDTLPVIVIGTPAELDALPSGPYIKGAYPFDRAISVVANASVMLCSESCMMHVAQSLKVPSVILHTHEWTKNVTAPYREGTKHLIWSASEVSVARATQAVKEVYATN